jgi:hypothetical protein
MIDAKAIRNPLTHATSSKSLRRMMAGRNEGETPLARHVDRLL